MLAGDVGLLRDNQWKLADREKGTETTLEITVPQLKDLNPKVAAMDRELKTLTNRLEDAERKHNIHLMVVQERVEGPSLDLYIEAWQSDMVLGEAPS
ncbi:hypothetical protein NDU88_006772 [Pleurodeles waltl]|uniref:Uncharacterized protein n=1 Tax=Pleurodeles waltl TaxID=8319 RepID=A0AAV7VQN0_PLEWA|nr:hypothetical protein NDU88_006772 [Pleurodeles waltl]